MARKPKIGIDYFSHDVDTISDRKIRLLKSKHGILGYAVYMRLLEEIYKEHGYYMTVDEDNMLIFADENKMEYDKTMDVVNDCIKYELFSEKLYKKHKILTSRRIQENYLTACERRKQVTIYMQYWLVEIGEEYKNKDNVNIYSINVNNNKVYTYKSTQRKEENNTEEESKEEEKEKPSDLLTLFGQVKVKRSKYQTLIEEYGESLVNDKAETMDNWCKSKGKSYTNYGAALHNWLKKDAKKEQEKKDKPMSAKTKRDADGTDWIFENMG